MPIISQRESLSDANEVAANTHSSRAVKERILSKLGIQADPEPAAQSLRLEPETTLPVRNMVAERTPSPTPSEAPAADESMAEIKEEALSPRLAALARREREITRRMQQFAAEKKAFEDQRAAAANQPRDVDTGKFISKEDLEKDLIGTLSKHGYDYNKITETMLQPENSEAERRIRQLEAKLQELEGLPTKIEETLQGRQKLEYDAAVSQIRRDVAATVANSADYTTVKESGSVEAVVKLIEKTFEETGDMLSIEEAASQVEDYLIEEAIKVANYTKVKARVSQPPTEAQAPQQSGQKLSTQQLQQRPNSQIQLKTLTNATGALTTKARTENERRARAIAAAKGEKL